MSPISNDEPIKEINKEIDIFRTKVNANLAISEALGQTPRLEHYLDRLLSGKSSQHPKIFESLGLNPLKPDGGDPIASLFMNISGIQIFLNVLIVLLLAFIPMLAAFFEGNLVNTSLKPDLLHDLGYWNLFMLGFPAVIAIIGMYFSKLSRVFFQLAKSNIFTLSKRNWNEFTNNANKKIYGMKLLVLLPYLVGFIVMFIVIIFFVLGEANSWHSPVGQPWGTIAGWLHVPLAFFCFYLITLAVSRLITTFLVLKKFFKFPANINALHPDGCGGLYPLGKLSMGLNIGTFLFGIISVLGIFSNIKSFNFSWHHPLNILIIFGYITGATIAFFLPLYAAHQQMRETKYHTIQVISHRFERLNKEILSDLKGTEEINQSKLGQLESLKKLHSIAAKMPVYPFNFVTISSFLTSITPIFIFIFEKLIKNSNIFKLLKSYIFKI